MSNIVEQKDSSLIPSYLDELIPVKRTFKRDCKVQQIIDYIVKDISKSSKKSKSDLGMLERICMLIENCVKKKDKIINLILLLKF